MASMIVYELERRFWLKVDKTAHAPCWIWTAGCSDAGYGKIRFQSKDWLVHRISCELAHGPIPDGMFVCHRCDNPPCVNPAHLFLGTAADNIRDCAAKGRLVDNRGERHGCSKLTDSQVQQIRTAIGPQRRVAKQFGISQAQVSAIRNKRAWAHI